MINEELISAYLDGELTAQEQAQVEQALASDTRLRQMHDDLRSLRTSLQALPQQKLDIHFAERVLQAAKKAQHDNAATAPVVTPHEPEVIVTSHHGATVELAQHEPFAWRMVVWTVAGLAAVLMVMLFLPRSTEIAELPENQTKVAKKPAEPPAELEKLERNRPAAPQSGSENGSVDAPAAEPKTFEKQLQSRTAAKDAASQLDRSTDKVSSAEAFSTQRSVERSNVAGKKFDQTETPRFGGLMRGAQPPQAAQSVEGTVAAQPAELAEGPAARRQSKSQQQEFTQAALGDQVLVVRLQTSRKLVDARAIDDVLSRNAIALRDADAASDNKKSEALADDERRLESRDNALREAPGNIKRHVVDQLAKASANADVVYVEASLDQVQSTLAELRAQPDTTLAFTSLDKAEAEKNFFGAGAGAAGAAPGNASNELLKPEAAGAAPSVATPPPPAPVLADAAPPGAAPLIADAAKAKQAKEQEEEAAKFRGRNLGFAERLSDKRKDDLLQEAGEQKPSAESSNAPTESGVRSSHLRAFNSAASDEVRGDAPSQQRRVRVIFVIEAKDE